MKKKNRKTSRIPKFKSLEEEAKFWDTHSVTDFEDETEDVKIMIDLAKPRDDTLILRIQKPMKDKIASIADKKGITTSTLARIWLAEKLSQFA